MATLDQLVQAYHKLNDIADEKKKALKVELEEIESKIGKVKGAIANMLNELGVESARTNYGTPYFSHPESYNVTEKEEFIEWVVENKAFGILPDTIARKEEIRQAMEDHGITAVPGVQVTTVRRLNIKKS